MTGTQRVRPAVSALALAAALGVAGTAQAAVTAQQVWDDWKQDFAMYGENGVTIGSEELAGGVLTVTDIGLNSTGADGTTVTGTLASIVITENGDGTVSVTTADEFPLTIATPGDPSVGMEPGEVSLAIRHSGLTMTVSGDPGALTYDMTAARYAVELDSVIQGGADVPAEAMVAFNGVSGTYVTTTDAMRQIDYDLGADSLDILVDFTNPDDGSRVTVSGKVEAIATQATAVVPTGAMADPERIMMEGLEVDGGYTYGAATYLFEVADASGPTSGSVSTQSGELSFRVAGDTVGYESSVTGVAVDATSAMLPFPINASLAEYGVTVLIPMAQSDEPAPWAFGLNLTDLAVNEEIWALFDPGAMLPRDPATAIVDMTGTATMFFDLMDPEQQAAMDAAAVPGEVNSVTLNDLTLSIGGAVVTGTGDFTLDNADTTTFPGMPRPTGSAEFRIEGLNGLIDTLVAMGLLPQEQVMGARMMLGLLAVPVGEDILESRIEVTPDGQLLANGQRLQ